MGPPVLDPPGLHSMALRLSFEAFKFLNFDPVIWIQIQLFTLMWIGIQLPKIIRIRNPASYKD
jgi:hypothetical protein